MIRSLLVEGVRGLNGYDSVDLDILWQIISHDLPALITALDDIV